MVVNMYKHMGKVVIKILQGSAVTQTALGGLTIYSSGCKFPVVYMCQKLWKLASSKQSYCKKLSGPVFWAHPVYNSNKMCVKLWWSRLKIIAWTNKILRWCLTVRSCAEMSSIRLHSCADSILAPSRPTAVSGDTSWTISSTVTWNRRRPLHKTLIPN